MRGKDEYVRISWDEALDLVAGEITRIRKTYGPAAITAMASSHHNWGCLFYKMGPYCRFYNLLGYTELLDNPDSWEGWHWGAVHAWGYYWKLGHCDNFDILAGCFKEHRAGHLLVGRSQYQRRRLLRTGYRDLAAMVERAGYPMRLYRSLVQLHLRPSGRINGSLPVLVRMPLWRRPLLISGSKKALMINGS